jgi:hypothetical protein
MKQKEIYAKLCEEFDRREKTATVLTDGVPWRKNKEVVRKLKKTAKRLARNEVV